MNPGMPEQIPGGGIDLSHLAQDSRNSQNSPAAGANQAGPANHNGVVDIPSVVFELTDQNWEAAVQLSSVVPVVIELWSEQLGPSGTLGPVLEKITREGRGKVALGKVNADANPQLVQAFQAQSVPLVVALVAGRPVQLFQGEAAEPQIREVFGQLLELAKSQGITGEVSAPDLDAPAGDEESAAEVEEPINPEHEAALAALNDGKFAQAAEEYAAVLKRNPRDDEARAALAQVKLLERLQGHTTEEVRQTAASHPDDIDAQLLVADLDVSGGHVEDGFLRVLDLFAAATEENREKIQTRLLELFEVVGAHDPRVSVARRQFANLLY